MRNNDTYADTLVEIACELACAVRDDGPDAAARLLATLSTEDRDTLPIIMAAMIPVDLSVGDLLAWHTGVSLSPHGQVRLVADTRKRANRRRRGLAACGTHTAFNRHKARGEELDDACKLGERIYQRNRKRKQRAA
ncbi:hypothetical protein ACIBHY_29450 [Nonomuraea sp. NPDC050547]|uniref:hypothetical protein n=1 Tax=unclassified Nonomuraea TaxID=2593643 RepID=UPI00379784BC